MEDTVKYIQLEVNHLPFLALLEIGGLTLCMVNIYLLLRRERNPFEKVLLSVSVYIAFHILCAFVTQQFFLDKPWLERGLPVGLMYGPYFYFGFSAALGRKLSRRQVLLHSIPFFIFLVLGAPLYFSRSLREDLYAYYGVIMYSVTGISMASYMVWGLLIQGAERQGRLKQLFSTFGLLLFLVAALFLIILFNYLVPGPSRSLKSMSFLILNIYLALLCVAIYIFKYNSDHLYKAPGELFPEAPENGSEEEPAPEEERGPEEEEEAGPYRKSALPETQLAAYAARLEQLVQGDRIYLDPALSLATLATRMKIPRHHLSQLFSRHYNSSFSQYINALRVEHACTELLKQAPENENLEDLALHCGFNSKTSFNRYFKAQTGYTPSEYRAKHTP
ncbi:MAG: AraC family transcriptional regulator [Bacteroidia bacterium]|nr:AraC family transcriptional regulator [Bacteroidia bacterium]